MATETRPVELAASELEVSGDQSLAGPLWSSVNRIAFRFCFVNFGTYILITQMGTLLIPGIVPPDSPALESLWPVRHIVSWTALKRAASIKVIAL